MSITAESAKAHANDPAVTCCRFEAGTVIDASNLEDPAILPDLQDSGLLKMPEDCLKIGEVMGATLKVTVDALTPLTADLLDGVTSAAAPAVEAAPAAVEAPAAVVAAAPVVAAPAAAAGSVRITIGKGENITLDIPLGVAPAMGIAVPAAVAAEAAPAPAAAAATAAVAVAEEKIVREVTRKHFKIEKVELSDTTRIDGTTLYLRKDVCADALKTQHLVTDIKFEIITPDKYNTYSETIMDVQPIATKESGKLGEGVTRVLDGVVMVVTGVDENRVQIGEFGSSEGEMDKNIMFGRPGCPDHGEILIKTEVVIEAGTNMERPGPLAAHLASDFITDEIRRALKDAPETLVVSTETFKQVRRPGRKKIAIVKEIMGQGAMHDNLILPVEPVGTLGAKPNVDLGNLPVAIAPTEVIDGAIHALTCIGPASKEMSRHYFREPLVLAAMADEEFDLATVVFVGSPQVNNEKFYVSDRLGMMLEAMDLDGVIITTEGFGNNHIDFAAHHEQVGTRGIPVVGMSFSATQGALVVGNKYMTHMVDNNKSKLGIENEILANNTLCHEDAIRALAMLKVAIAGEPVKEAERKFNPNVKAGNVERIQESMGVKMDLVKNEQVLEKSKKRKEIYEVEA